MIRKDCKNLQRHYTGEIYCTVHSIKGFWADKECKGCVDYW